MSDFETIWNILVPPVEISHGGDDVPDPTSHLFAKAQLASTMTKSADADDWDEEINVPVQKTTPVDGERLEKAYTSMRQTNRRVSLTEFVKRSLAGGETVSGLVEHARKHDLETAEMLAQIGAELGAD